MGDELRLELLGGLRASRGGVPLADLRSRKAQALLAYLAVTGRPHPREALAGLLWGSSPEAFARTSLRQALANLRRLVGDHLETTHAAAGLRPEGVWTDAAALEALLAESAPAAATGATGEADLDRLRAAVALYGGDFLAGLGVPDAPAFDEWAAVERERLRQAAVGALRRLAAAHAARGAPDEAGAALRRALALEPWLEEAHRELMAVLAGAGRRSEALAQYAACRRVLAEELGVEPAAETTALYERIRAGPVAPRASAGPGAPGAPAGAAAAAAQSGPAGSAPRARPAPRPVPPPHPRAPPATCRRRGRRWSAGRRRWRRCALCSPGRPPERRRAWSR
jgi:DNA-binding SARP family transcriptional activator